MNPIKLLFQGVLSVIALTACVPNSADYSPEQNLHGSRIPFVHERNNAQYVSLARHVGRLNITFKELNDGPISSQVCTGTAIGGGYFITAQHCLNGRVVDASLETNALSATTYSTANIDVPSFQRVARSADIAIGRFRGGNAPRGKTFVARQVRVNEPLFILHHPEGLPLSVTDRNCSASATSETTFMHTCDTLNGSSGALIFAKIDGAVVGIHTAGSFSRQIDNYAYHIIPLIKSNPTLARLFQQQEAARRQPTPQDFEAVRAIIAVNQGETERMHAFVSGKWVGLGNPPVRQAQELARKYCTDTIGVNCGKHGNWSIVAPPNHDPSSIGVRVCGRDGNPYQLRVIDVNNFSYLPLTNPISPELRTQTVSFRESLRGFDRSSWGDTLLSLLEDKC